MVNTQPTPPARATEANLRRVVVALDGSARAERVLGYVEQFALHTGARVTLVRAWAPHADADSGVGVGAPPGDAPWPAPDPEARNARHQAERYLEQVVAGLRDRGVAADYELVEGPAGQTIVDAAEGLRAEMVAMTTHGRSGLGRLVLGSVADYVVRHALCPVLLVRAA